MGDVDGSGAPYDLGIDIPVVVMALSRAVGVGACRDSHKERASRRENHTEVLRSDRSS